MMAGMRPDLPTGTVTFLFMDVEGSTKLMYELGAEAYAEALGEHRQIVREVFRDNGGVEVDAQGDAFFVAFQTAPAALRAGAQALARLDSGPIRVRIGLHTGTPILTDEGYVGADVHRAARIAASGHGGQVLVSAATAALVGTSGLRDLGQHRLKDLAAIERIYQLGDGAFPPLRGLHESNLPIPSTPFLGRQNELTEILGLLSKEGVRLTTLTGPGGTGKTRLALQAAAVVGPRYPDGIWWIPLASLRDPELVLQTAGHALGAKHGLAEHIADSSMVLLFDNFEHVIEAAADVAGLLASCPNLHLLVTSREPLHLSGEQEYPVPTLNHSEGVGLFVARAVAIKPDFTPDDAVSDICRRLDDLPLALELAAVRVKLLSTKQILERLEQRLPLLTGGARDLSERQRTLRATIAWSYDLLSLEERHLFASLSVFVAGCTLSAAAAVIPDWADSQRGPELLEDLGHLVEQSVLRVATDHPGGEPRFSMLETIREFALDQLSMAERETLRDRHLAYFVGLAEASENEERGIDQAAWVRRLAADRDNFRSALAHAQQRRDADQLLRLAAALERRFWLASGDRDLSESRRWLEAGLAMEGAAPPGLRAKALLRMAWTVGESHVQTRAFLEESLSEYERAGDEAGMTDALSGLGHVAVLSGDFTRADNSLHRALALSRRIGVRPQILVEVLVPLGLLAMLRRQYAVAGRHLDEALAVARRSGDTWGTAFALEHMGRLALSEGDDERAMATLSESVELLRTVGDTEQGAEAALYLSTALISSGALDGARALIRDVAMATHDLIFWYRCLTLEATAEWLAAAGLHPAAVKGLAAAAQARAELGETIEVDWETARRQLLQRMRHDVPRVEFDAAWAAGQGMSLADALEDGLRAMDAVGLAAPTHSRVLARGRRDLSRRELEVLALVAAGQSDGEIAERLFISKKTASVHVAHIKDKLGAESRVQMAMVGVRLGLASADDPGASPSG